MVTRTCSMGGRLTQDYKKGGFRTCSLIVKGPGLVSRPKMDWQGMTLTQARPTGNTRSWATNCISLFQQTWGRRGGDKPSLRHQWPRKDNASGRTDSCLEWGSTKGCREPKHGAWIQALMGHRSWPPQTALRDRANLLPLHSTLWETGYSWLNIETHQRHWILNRNWDHKFRTTC